MKEKSMIGADQKGYSEVFTPDSSPSDTRIIWHSRGGGKTEQFQMNQKGRKRYG